MSLPCLHPAPGGVLLDVVVQPRASRNEAVGLQGDELKLRLTSPPVDGAANKACCAFVAKLMGVPKGAVTLVGGQKSRHKRLQILGLALEEGEAVVSPFLEP